MEMLKGKLAIRLTLLGILFTLGLKAQNNSDTISVRFNTDTHHPENQCWSA